MGIFSGSLYVYYWYKGEILETAFIILRLVVIAISCGRFKYGRGMEEVPSWRWFTLYCIFNFATINLGSTLIFLSIIHVILLS